MTTEPGDWHADAVSLQALADGRLGPAIASSLESHVMRCSDCRTALNALELDRIGGQLERAWTGVRDRIEAPADSGVVEAWLRRLGFRSEQLRLLTAVPALRGAWLTGVTLALVFAGVAAGFAGDRGLAFFLLVAPLAPVAGVAMAYGGDADPSQEIVVATPFSAVRLLLLRTAAVVVTSVPIAVIVGLLIPGPSWLFVAWLTPAAACVGVTLALSPYVGLTSSATLVGAIWSVLTLVATRAHGDPLVLVGQASQLACSALILVSVSLLVTKLSVIDLPRRQS